jgi:hypothetical protein
LTDVERKDCFPLPAQFRCDEQHWFMGMLLYQDHLVLILNPSWVLGESAVTGPPSIGPTEQMIAATPLPVGRSC